MSSGTVSIFKFVGTISLGLLTGLSASLATSSLPALLSLPTASTARTTVSYLSSRSTTISTYLRHITTFSLFSAYLLSPRRSRHPYLLYTAIIAFGSGMGVDYAVDLKNGGNEKRISLDLEAQGEDVNGEEVGRQVERMRVREGVRSLVAGLGFGMSVLGIWGEGA